MSKYQIAYSYGDKSHGFIRRETSTNKYSPYEYFAGYDFMGSVIWAKQFSFDYEMSIDECKQIVKDLDAAGEDE